MPVLLLLFPLCMTIIVLLLFFAPYILLSLRQLLLLLQQFYCRELRVLPAPSECQQMAQPMRNLPLWVTENSDQSQSRIWDSASMYMTDRYKIVGWGSKKVCSEQSKGFVRKTMNVNGYRYGFFYKWISLLIVSDHIKSVFFFVCFTD